MAGVCPKSVSVVDNTDTDMLVKDHVETTDLSCLTHVGYDRNKSKMNGKLGSNMDPTFRLDHNEGKSNTEQMKVADQDGLAHVGINDNKGEVDTKPRLNIDLQALRGLNRGAQALLYTQLTTPRCVTST